MNETPTTLNGRAVWLARAAWLAIFLLILGIVVANAPHLVSDTRLEWQVGKAMTAAQTIFPSTSAFVRYVAVLKAATALVFGATAFFLAWRKSDDWMVLYTSAALLLMVVLFGFGLNEDTIRYPRPLVATLNYFACRNDRSGRFALDNWHFNPPLPAVGYRYYNSPNPGIFRHNSS